jgi:hypothetical protein
MEQQSATKENKGLQKTFVPCNYYLLCKKVEIEEKVGNIILADPDKWIKKFEVVATSPNLLTYIDKYEIGDVLIYPIGQPTMYINIDGDDFYFLDKRYVVTKV